MQVTIELHNWTPGDGTAGVVEETYQYKGHEPEVTHGVKLLPGGGVETLAQRPAIGDVVVLRGHVDTSDGNSQVCYPGDCLELLDGKAVRVLSKLEAARLCR